jgi:hypothetical protein
MKSTNIPYPFPKKLNPETLEQETTQKTNKERQKILNAIQKEKIRKLTNDHYPNFQFNELFKNLKALTPATTESTGTASAGTALPPQGNKKRKSRRQGLRKNRRNNIKSRKNRQYK